MKKINLIFTRDFDQWVQNIIRDSLVIDAPKIWGKGITDQIVHFDGVTFYWYRYQKDMEKLKSFLIHKSIDSEIFSITKQDAFLKLIKDLRLTINSPISKIKNNKKHLTIITKLFKEMYPYYPLGIFIAGPWREDFLKIHGKDGQEVLNRLLHSREQSEGLLKIVGLHLRSWLGPMLKKHNYPSEYVRLLTVLEIKNFIEKKKLPSKNILEKRARGYIYINGKIIISDNFNKFLVKNKLAITNLEPTSNANSISGVVACRGDIIRGKVKKIYNSYGVSAFKSGEILVTPMTSPEYLSAMRKAAAIITDEGGLTCHAAIVARELKKPCIIGTKVATKLFQDGDLIEVNANKGIIRKL
ncbi:MAG: PEP-utilizing enzyme [Patescibacteria group bacterium]